LQRFLDRRPILARRSSPAERLIRWSKRNPVVAGAVVAVFVALTVGTTVSYVKYREAEHNREIAEVQQEEAVRQARIAVTKEQEARRQAERAQKARDFLVSIFRISERDLRTGNITARQILAEAERRVPVEFAGQPELRDELIAAIADVKRGIARQVPQAMILESSGDVWRQSATGEPRVVQPQALVNLDDRVTVGPGGRIRLVFLSDFHKEDVKPGREVTVDEKGCQPADAVLERDNSILMSFVRLPKATFYMGWGVPDPRTKEPRKGVKTDIPEDFEIAVHTVTQGQWEAVMGFNPSTYSRTGPVRWRMQDISDEELKLFPVESISWEDAQAFVKKINQLERGKGYRYRLPTEAEWEYACRCGATSEEECSYAFYLDKPTNHLSATDANFNGHYPFDAPKGPFLARTTRVGAYPPNRLGLCDMHGNVWQWCEEATPGATQVTGRGGMYGSEGIDCQVTSRSDVRPTFRDFTRGFRLVRVRIE
jgi:formylglycine-generating enzyme required for sulfatase activity